MSIWEHIFQQITLGEQLAFLYVIQSEGSSPGRKGFCMIVNKQGKMEGSIGGGIMEQKLIELARTKLSSGGFKPFIMNQVHRKESDRNQSGMIALANRPLPFIRWTAPSLNCLRKLSTAFKKEPQEYLNYQIMEFCFSKIQQLSRRY